MDVLSNVKTYTVIPDSSGNHFIAAASSANCVDKNPSYPNENSFYQPHLQIPNVQDANPAIVKTVLVYSTAEPSVCTSDSSNLNYAYAVNNSNPNIQYALVPVEDVSSSTNRNQNVEGAASNNPSVMNDKVLEKTNAAEKKPLNANSMISLIKKAYTDEHIHAMSVEEIEKKICKLLQLIVPKIQNPHQILDVTKRNMYICLKHPLEQLVRQDPESIPFRYPVQDQNYYRIVKNPMNFVKINSKLSTYQYSDPWEFIDDVWLVFNNAWLYYKKSSRPDRYATKLSKIFNSVIDKAMQKMGYCCGQYYLFEPNQLLCYNKANCYIAKLDKYWDYGDKYFLCKRCYCTIEDEVTFFLTPEENLVLKKEQFVEKRNDVYRNESFVDCMRCIRKFHKICVLYHEEIWKDGYICDTCLNSTNKIRKFSSLYTSESLQHNTLSSFLESRVHKFLRRQKMDLNVNIRVLSQDRKEIEVKPGAKSRFVDTGIWPASFPYTAKALFAFQKIDNYDVCFFSMLVQEYDSTCPKPNQGNVYISYLDSVNFFVPKHLRTAVYHEILLGYLQYVKSQGFLTVHLWSCPANKGEDYIFYCHPPHQKNPSVRKLQEWYKLMLEKGIREGIVMSYKHLFKQALDDNIKCVSELPYFDGDYWPSVIENEIAKIEGKAEKEISIKRGAMLEEMDTDGKDISLEVEKLTYGNKIKRLSRPPRSSIFPYTGDLLMDKVYATMSKYRETFIVIHLWPTGSMPECVITDPDSPIPSSLIGYRESFLEFCREKVCEFSSLRRAKYSTMVFLHELHKESIDTVTCNICKAELEIWHQCTVCKDFDLCKDCFDLKGHEHTMEKMKKETKSDAYCVYENRLNYYIDKKGFSNVLKHASLCYKGCALPFCLPLKELDELFKGVLEKKTKRGPSFRFYLFHVFHLHFKDCQNHPCHLIPCRYFRILKNRRDNQQLANGSQSPSLDVFLQNSALIQSDTTSNPLNKYTIPKIVRNDSNNLDIQNSEQPSVSRDKNSSGKLVIISSPRKNHNLQNAVRSEDESQSCPMPRLESTIAPKLVPFDGIEKLSTENYSDANFPNTKQSFKIENKTVVFRNSVSHPNLKTVTSNCDGKPMAISVNDTHRLQPLKLSPEAVLFNGNAKVCNPHSTQLSQNYQGAPKVTVLSSVSKPISVSQAKNLLHSSGYVIESQNNKNIFTGLSANFCDTNKNTQGQMTSLASTNSANLLLNTSSKTSGSNWFIQPQNANSLNKNIIFLKKQSQTGSVNVQSSSAAQYCDNVFVDSCTPKQIISNPSSVQNTCNVMYTLAPPSYNSHMNSQSRNEINSESQVFCFTSDNSNIQSSNSAVSNTAVNFTYSTNESVLQNSLSVIPDQNSSYNPGETNLVQRSELPPYLKHVQQNVQDQGFDNVQQRTEFTEVPCEIKSEVPFSHSYANACNSNFADSNATKNNQSFIILRPSRISTGLSTSDVSLSLKPTALTSSPTSLPKSNAQGQTRYQNVESSKNSFSNISATVPYTVLNSSNTTAISTSAAVSSPKLSLSDFTNEQKQHILAILNSNPQNSNQLLKKRVLIQQLEQRKRQMLLNGQVKVLNGNQQQREGVF